MTNGQSSGVAGADGAVATGQEAMGGAQGRGYRRAALPVRNRFQVKYTTILVSLVVVFAAATSFLLYQAASLTTKLIALDPDTATLGQEIAREDFKDLLIPAVIGVLLAAALAIWGIVYTHRLAGPVVYMGKILEEVRQGRYPRVRPLRHGDELQEFFSRFQAAVESLATRDARIRDAVARLKAGDKEGALKACEDALQPPATDALPPPAAT